MESMIVFNEKNINNDLVKSLDQKDNNNWVLIPPPVEERKEKPPPSFPTLPIQCAADFGNNIACCGQPPAVVPYENTCKAEAPYCSGYVANEKWGSCQLDVPKHPEKVKLVSPPPEKPTFIPDDPVPNINVDPKIFTIQEVSELDKGSEPSIIGRFDKYVLWNVHSKTSNLAQVKIKIDNAGYMLMQDDFVPKQGATTFDGYDINSSVKTIADNYTKTKMPTFQNTGSNAIFFPSKTMYSNTYGKDYIANTKNENLFEIGANERELNGFNIFIVLVDPKY